MCQRCERNATPPRPLQQPEAPQVRKLEAEEAADMLRPPELITVGPITPTIARMLGFNVDDDA